MNEVRKFLADNPHYRPIRKGYGLMRGCFLVGRRDGRNWFDADQIWFVIFG